MDCFEDKLIKHFEMHKEAIAGNLDDLSQLDIVDNGNRCLKSEAMIKTFEYVIKYIKGEKMERLNLNK